MIKYCLNEISNGNTSILVDGQYLRPKNKLGEEPYWWGATSKACSILMEYIEHKNVIANKKLKE